MIRNSSQSVAVCVFLSILVMPTATFAQAQQGLLGCFRFNGDAISSTPDKSVFFLKNTQFRDNCLYLDGQYEHNKDKNGYRAMWNVPSMDYNRFTIFLRVKSEDFDPPKNNIVTGGVTHRWFCLDRSPKGCLNVSINNGQVAHEIKAFSLETDKWYNIACSVNIAKQKILVSVNGSDVETVSLPPNIRLNTTDGEGREVRDRNWTFSNYSSGKTFHGLVDEFRLYGKIFSDKQLRQLSK